MPKQTKICRVCGATYEACNSARSGSSAFTGVKWHVLLNAAWYISTELLLHEALWSPWRKLQ